MNPELPLKDIHLPASISWWPTAPGWWIAFGLFLLLSFLIVIAIKKHFKPTLKKEANQALNVIEKAFCESGDAQQCLCALSAFLRRVSLSYHTSMHAGLTGLAWLQLLDQPLTEPEFSQGIGKILLDAPYRHQADVEEASQLIVLCRKWINRL